MLSLFLCMVLESVLVSFFYKRLTSFPAPLVKEIVFNRLYTLASFVKDKVSIGAWIYLWAFYFVPLIYASVFVPVPYCLDDCCFIVYPEISLRLYSQRIKGKVWEPSNDATDCIKINYLNFSKAYSNSEKEENRKPRDKSTHLWTPYLQQRRQEYTMD